MHFLRWVSKVRISSKITTCGSSTDAHHTFSKTTKASQICQWRNRDYLSIIVVTKNKDLQLLHALTERDPACIVYSSFNVGKFNCYIAALEVGRQTSTVVKRWAVFTKIVVILNYCKMYLLSSSVVSVLLTPNMVSMCLCQLAILLLRGEMRAIPPGIGHLVMFCTVHFACCIYTHALQPLTTRFWHHLCQPGRSQGLTGLSTVGSSLPAMLAVSCFFLEFQTLRVVAGTWFNVWSQ